MGILQRIGDFFRMLFSGFVDTAENSVPLERRLAYDRVKRAENLKKQMGAAEDVGAAAEMMVQQLAEARIMAANVRHEAKSHLKAAVSAAKRGDTVTQQQEEGRATALADELAASEEEVTLLENLVEEALHDKRESIDMVLDQAKELEKLSRGDSRLVARARMTGMRRQQLELREQMMDLVPGDQSNVRARMQEQIGKDEAKFRARRDVVDAMWEQKRRTTTDRSQSTTAAGAAALAQLKAEVGYPEEAEPAAAAGDTLEQLKREVGYEAPAEAAKEAASAASAEGAGGE